MDFSISDLIRQNTVGQSEGFPAGVPRSYSWYRGWNAGGEMTPPADFTAVEGWGQVYPKVGAAAADANSNAIIEVANAKTYVHIKQTGRWILVQDQSKLQMTGAHFVPDFAGNEAIPMKVTPLPGGQTAFDVPPAGYNNHFWYKSRGTYAAGTVDAVYVQMDMRVTDSNLKLVAMVGADWWRDASAPYLDDHSNNPGIGGTNWVELSIQWKTLGYYSMSTERFRENLPPPLLGFAPSPLVISSDTVAPATPEITSFKPDTGTVGHKITSTSVLTLNGTAEVGGIVSIFDGPTQIGTAKTNASGAWSFTTTELSNAVHNFTAKATDAVGNVSSASPLLKVKVGTATGKPTPTPTPSGKKPLVKGSFDASPEGRSEWAGSGHPDGFYKTVQGDWKQCYDFSVDAGSWSGHTGSTTAIEVAWSYPFVLLPLIFGAVLKIRRNDPLNRLKNDSSTRRVNAPVARIRARCEM
jgi:hypothetical protein